MATVRKTVGYIEEQLSEAGDIATRPMFGEYGLYCDGKMVGIVADDQLFIKPTVGGRDFAGDLLEAAPYPQAKPYLLVDADRWEDAEWLSSLVRVTTAELPSPKPKKSKRAKQV